MSLFAPAKVNLGLYVGEREANGLHGLRSIVCPLALGDRLEVEEAERDEVVCEGVEGPNLAARALALLRGRGWRRAPIRVTIDKRIPVAAGLGGGSADAAAVLRLARGEVEGLEGLAAELGSDVPAQLEPGLVLVSGTGEGVEPLTAPHAFGCVLIAAKGPGLSAADVYAEADRIGIGRSAAELEGLERELRQAAGSGASPLDYAELLVNDLEPAALSLRPELGEALAALEQGGAARAFVSGSGPTAVGLFESMGAAELASEDLSPALGVPMVTGPLRSAVSR